MSERSKRSPSPRTQRNRLTHSNDEVDPYLESVYASEWYPYVQKYAVLEYHPLYYICRFILKKLQDQPKKFDKKKIKQSNVEQATQWDYDVCLEHYTKQRNGFKGFFGTLFSAGQGGIKYEKEIMELFVSIFYLSIGHNHLMEVKKYIDQKSICLHACFTNKNLVYTHCTKDEVRKQILATFSEVAEKQTKKRRVHILTDIDDTLFSAGTSAGGSDVSFAVHTYYPGVFAFHSVINTSDFTSLLSARPDTSLCGYGYETAVSSTFTENKQRERFLEAKKEQHIPHYPHVMLGDAGSMVSAATRGEICKDTVRNKFGEQWFIKPTQMPSDINEIVSAIPIENLCNIPDSWEVFFVNDKWANTYKYMAFTKYRHFCQFASIYPELDFVFIGDSGQGDLLTSILMQSHPQMKACLIKKVIESKELSKINLEKYDQLSADLAIMSNNKIFMFDNYIDAAIALCPELCTKTKLKKIANETISDLNTILGKIEINQKNEAFYGFLRSQFEESYKKAHQVG